MITQEIIESINFMKFSRFFPIEASITRGKKVGVMVIDNEPVNLLEVTETVSGEPMRIIAPKETAWAILTNRNPLQIKAVKLGAVAETPYFLAAAA